MGFDTIEINLVKECLMQKGKNSIEAWRDFLDTQGIPMKLTCNSTKTLSKERQEHQLGHIGLNQMNQNNEPKTFFKKGKSHYPEEIGEC